MRVGLVAMSSFPIPTPTHTGVIVMLDLAHGLAELGHDVSLYAPAGTVWPTVHEMPCSWGKSTPLEQDCEQACYDAHLGSLLKEDIVHDFSVNKRIVENLMRQGRPTISTLFGGQWTHPNPPRNICVWSNAMRLRGLRGGTDYEGTLLESMGGPPQTPIQDAHVVPGGIDTNWYVPDYGAKKKFFLWMNRWHPAKGYKLAIDIARETGIELVMAGEHPDNEMFEYQRNCALEAKSLAADLPNVSFRWLPPDPDHHNAKLKIYQQAKALLYTVQFQEPFGLAQVEALACGTPVLGTRLGSVPEVVDHGRTGYVCGNSVQDFETAIAAVDALDPEVCRTQAVQRYDRKVMAQAYINEYKAVLAGKGWG